MKKRPKWFLGLSLFSFIVAVGIPIQVLVIHEHSFWEWGWITAKISPFNAMVMILGFVNFGLLYRASPYLKYSVPAFVLAVFWNNWIVGSYGIEYNIATTALGTCAFMGFFGPLLKPDYRKVIANPKLRWWLRPTRVKTDYRVVLHPHVGKDFVAQSYDISHSGLFIPLERCWVKGKPMALEEWPFEVGQKTSMTVNVSPTNSIRCEAEIVRMAEASGGYPKGIGLRFTDMTRESQRYLRQHL